MPKKTIIQTHHISYSPEVTVRVYKGEHWILSQIQRRKRFSKGFVKALKVVTVLIEQDAVNLK